MKKTGLILAILLVCAAIVFVFTQKTQKALNQTTPKSISQTVSKTKASEGKSDRALSEKAAERFRARKVEYYSGKDKQTLEKRKKMLERRLSNKNTQSSIRSQQMNKIELEVINDALKKLSSQKGNATKAEKKAAPAKATADKTAVKAEKNAVSTKTPTDKKAEKKAAPAKATADKTAVKAEKKVATTKTADKKTATATATATAEKKAN